MRLDNRKILLVMVVITLLSLPVVGYTTGTFRVALGLVVIVFVPGYTLLAALFPDGHRLDTLSRLVLSLGMSLILVPLIGLLLHYSVWGVQLFPILVAMALFVVITTAVSWYRQRNLSPEDIPGIRINIRLPRWQQLAGLDRALTIALVGALMVVLGTFIYAVVTPDQGEPFTEFYITDVNGTTEGYPVQVLPGEAVQVMAGVVNHEGRDASYQIAVSVDGVVSDEFATGLLADGQRWQEKVSVTPQRTGPAQRLEFWLYETGSSQPYNQTPLYIYIDVSSTQSIK